MTDLECDHKHSMANYDNYEVCTSCGFVRKLYWNEETREWELPDES